MFDASTPAPPAAEQLTAVPDWIRRPPPDAFSKFFPEEARKQFLTGKATLQCKVTARGGLADCVAIKETPPGQGFGEAVLKLVSYFRMKPKAEGGEAVDGGEVWIPIHFVLPPDTQAGPVTVDDARFPGARVEVNCRYQGQSVDDCFVAQYLSPPTPVGEAALHVAEKAALPEMPRPAGRILLSIQFAGEAPISARPLVLKEPNWKRLPNARDLAEVFPERAARRGASGTTVTSCTVTAEGRLTNCVTVSESPIGMGFGAAALKLMPLFDMGPVTPDGRPVGGGTVRIPIHFTAPR